MHVRRALLLFAIVLGLAALAASISRSPGESDEGAGAPPPPAAEDRQGPTVSPGTAAPSEGVVELGFDAARDQTRRVDVDQPATVVVEVDEPGLVSIPALGLSAPAEPLTPARFDLLPAEPGRFNLEFTPATDDTPAPAGTLVVRATTQG